jgi:hypothetical protein
MGWFSKIKCPVCGWQVTPKVLRRPRSDEDLRVVGLLFFSSGYSGIEAVSPLRTPEELEESLKPEERGVFQTLKERFLTALERWCDFGWLDRFRDVLPRLGLFPLGGGLWVERFERLGERPRERIASEFDFSLGRSRELYRKKLPYTVGREVKDYEW